jgi:hypothetical protein
VTRSSRKARPSKQRVDEVRQVVYDINSLIANGKVKAVVDRKTGAVAFDGVDPNIRDGVTDACIYRRLMVSGSSLTKAAIARAEQVAGRSVNKQAVATGRAFSRWGSQSWHNGH